MSYLFKAHASLCRYFLSKNSNWVPWRKIVRLLTTMFTKVNRHFNIYTAATNCPFMGMHCHQSEKLTFHITHVSVLVCTVL